MSGGSTPPGGGQMPGGRIAHGAGMPDPSRPSAADGPQRGGDGEAPYGGRDVPYAGPDVPRGGRGVPYAGPDAQYGGRDVPYSDGDNAYGIVDEAAYARERGGGDGGRGGRLVGAVGLVVGALVVTGLSVQWIWDKADAVTPVSLPSANSTPLATVSPSAIPTKPPPPRGRVVGASIVAFNNDTMPLLTSAWRDNGGTDRIGLLGGASAWLTVHDKYDGKKSWGNYVAFGGLGEKVKYVNTPAGRKAATIQAATTALVELYDQNVQFIGKAVHTPGTVAGHPSHELSIKVVVKIPKLAETFSNVLVTVIDRGDGTAAVAIGDIAGSTSEQVADWRAKVQEIKIGG
ncbi:hypothetical protein [Kribbella sp. CA-293567]|uniref:hypothetical protein n=1 Tax=Kribbella sp. CA-293567 TaxID=3002436 RepID=UPI0022DD8B4E|nr:hypothetical protein [Kribbella sp. CA-293567]WBQ02681.1 hypothetical protein OX958_22150 [Kribbella sp. CA-293567]